MDIYKYCDCLFSCFVFQCSYFNLSYELLFSDHLFLEEGGNEIFDLSNPVLVNQNYKFDVNLSFSFPIKEEFDFLIFEVDLFDCFWTPYYKSFHISHFFTAINKNEYEWSGVDLYFHKNSFEVSNEWLYLYVKSYLVVNIREDHLDNDITIVLKYLGKRLCNNTNKVKAALIDLILDAECHVNEYVYNNYMGIPVIRRLKCISDNRMCYLNVLKYIEKKYKVKLTREKEEIEQIAILWNRLKLMVVKHIMKNNIKLNIYTIDQMIETSLKREDRVIYKIIDKIRGICYVE